MNSQDPQAQDRVDGALRALRSGATLLDLALALGRPAWLGPADVQTVTTLAGKIPVRLEADDTVLALRLSATPQGPVWTLYLRVAGRLSPAELLAVLHRAEADQPGAARRILELGWVETPR